jgi:hypothetical protein
MYERESDYNFSLFPEYVVIVEEGERERERQGEN